MNNCSKIGLILWVIVDRERFEIAGLVDVVGVVLVVGGVAGREIQTSPIHVGIALRVLAVLHVVRSRHVQVVEIRSFQLRARLIRRLRRCRRHRHFRDVQIVCRRLVLQRRRLSIA